MNTKLHLVHANKKKVPQSGFQGKFLNLPPLELSTNSVTEISFIKIKIKYILTMHLFDIGPV
jgi:hypothetical protein